LRPKKQNNSVWSPEAITLFSNQVLDKTVTLVLKSKADNFYKIDLYSKTQNLAELLLKEGHALREYEVPLAQLQLQNQKINIANGDLAARFNKQIKIDVNSKKEHEMAITCTYSPFCFYGQLAVELENFSKFEMTLNDFYQNLLQQSDLVYLLKPATGQMCIARYSEDGAWYRAIVKEVNWDLEEARVFFVDYGNEDTVKLDSKGLLVINNQFKEYPTMAIKCCLNGIKPLDENLPNKPSQDYITDFMFNAIAYDRVFVTFVDKTIDECWYVDLRIESKQDPTSAIKQ
jgi:hypothetical protein